MEVLGKFYGTLGHLLGKFRPSFMDLLGLTGDFNSEG
jgi:hypothetical protein